MPGGERLREEIIQGDHRAFQEARKVFTISATVSARLRKHNDFAADPLYHPPRHHEALHCRDNEDFIFYPSRVDSIKRQVLLVEAAAHLKSRIRLVIAGDGSRAEMRRLRELIRDRGLEDTIELTGRLPETDMIDFYSRCRAVYFGGFDEDYGYVPLEGLFSSKPVIVHSDAGGPLEFVEHNRNGYVVPPEPAALAAAMDILSLDPSLAESLGRQGRRDLQAHRLDWDHVIESLLS
jgi:glycosyltransferase involved in cell wall biosynthesis